MWLLDGKPHAVPSFSYSSGRSRSSRRRRRRRRPCREAAAVVCALLLFPQLQYPQYKDKGKEREEEEPRSNHIDLFYLNIKKEKRRKKRN